MSLRIDKKLNLVIPIERDDGGTLYVHSMPISREVFKRYYMVIAKTFTQIYAEGLTAISGPAVATLVLETVARSMDQWDGQDGVETGLLSEIRRLSNVIAPTPQGWNTLPLETSVAHGILASDEVEEVMNTVVFFTVASSMHRKSDLPGVFEAMRRLWGAQTSSSTCTEYAAFLPRLTETGSSGETPTPGTAPILSVPS